MDGTTRPAGAHGNRPTRLALAPALALAATLTVILAGGGGPLVPGPTSGIAAIASAPAPTAAATPSPASRVVSASASPRATASATASAAPRTASTTLHPTACRGTSGKASGSSATETSQNWAGYIVSGAGLVSCVEATWVVPHLSCSKSAPASDVAIWVGFDGVTTTSGRSPLVQTGIQVSCQKGATSVFAWHEVFPAQDARAWSMTIHPGDLVSAQVLDTGGMFHLTFSDLTTHQTDAVSQRVAHVQRQAAEWIVEAPALCPSTCHEARLASFGTVQFTSVDVVMGGVRAGVLGPWDRFGVDLQDAAGQSARVNAPTAAGRAFSVTWRHA